MIETVEGQLSLEELTASTSVAESAMQPPESAVEVGGNAEQQHSVEKLVGEIAKREDSEQQGGAGAVTAAIIEQGGGEVSQSLWEKVKEGAGGAAGVVAGAAVDTWGGVKGWWAARKEAEREMEAEELRGDALH